MTNDINNNDNNIPVPSDIDVTTCTYRVVKYVSVQHVKQRGHG